MSLLCRALGVRVAAVLAALVLVGNGCEPDDGEGSAKSWKLVLRDLDAALLGVWGSSASDVFAVGADTGNGPLVLHWDGSTWTKFGAASTGASGGLWWVAGTDATGPVWMAGEGGLVLRYDRAADTFSKIGGVPSTVTLFGIFATGAGFADVWAVGGDTDGAVGHVYKLDGAAFVEDTTMPEAARTAGQFFKVWGRSSNDLWVVGLGNKMMHRSASGWSVIDTPQGRRLFTMHGNDTTAIAVGGFATGLVVEALGAGAATVSDATPPGVKQLNGVWVDGDGSVVAVGVEGTVTERRGTVWKAPSGLPQVLDDYHAVYVDPEGGVWAVGGFIVVTPGTDGMLLHYGPSISSTIVTSSGLTL